MIDNSDGLYTEISGKVYEVVSLDDLISEKAYDLNFYADAEKSSFVLDVFGIYCHFNKYSFWARYKAVNFRDQKIGTYLLVPKNDSGIYIGSTSDITDRRLTHRSSLERHCHKNFNIQKAYDDGLLEGMSIIFIPMPDRETAYELEEILIGYIGSDRKLFNISADPKKSFITRPDEVEASHARRSAASKEVHANPVFKAALSRAMRKLHSNPIYKEKHLAGVKRAAARQETRENLRAAMDKFRNDPVRYRAFEKKMRERTWSNPDMIEKRKEGIARLNADPVRKSAMLANRAIVLSDPAYRARISETRQEMLKNNPDVSKRQAASLREYYKDPAKRLRQFEMVKTSKALNINGVSYRSVHDASRLLGLARITISERLRTDDPKYSEWRYL